MSFDPLVPRPTDLPTTADGDLDSAKIIAAPADPARWPAWRDRLVEWRDGARRGYDGALYERPEYVWTQACFAVGLVWLWDELLYDFEAGRFTPERLLEHGEQEFGGFDGLVLWHAYPVIGIDDRNQFDWYREVFGIRELVSRLRAAGVRVFLDYNPWDTGTRREPVSDATAVAGLVSWLDADGVFLDTLKHAPDDLRVALDAVRPGVAFEGESTLPLDRLQDHHLSWAQWFADSDVPGVIRARWFEQRHMLHGTRRWNRDHTDELHSSWLNGTGMLVWECVFGAWVGWSERDKGLLQTMLGVQRRHARLLTHGEWTPLAAHSGGLEIVGSRWVLGDATLWALVNRSESTFAGAVDLDGIEIEIVIPARGVAAREPDGRITISPGGSGAFPARLTARVAAPVVQVAEPPAGMVACPAPGPQRAVFRRRETGTYGEAPYVEEWKPLPPRLHDFVEIDRPPGRGRFAIAVHEEPLRRVTLDEARAHAAAQGARLPTEDEWQAAAAAGVLERARPRVWEWTESEHRDGRTRFAILKGGSDLGVTGSDWYVDSGDVRPERSLKLLLTRSELQRSPSIGFRLAVDLP